MLIQKDAQQIERVLLDDCRISLEEFVAVVRFHAQVDFSQEYCRRVTAGREALEQRLSSGEGVYGVNTGFGDNVRYRITEEEMSQLQENIIRSHGTSVGRPMSEEGVRSMMMMILTNTGKGHSAIRLEILETVRQFLNEGIYPYVPEEGTIGGLSYQPYMAMTFMGEGRIIEDGRICPAAEVLAHRGIAPIVLKAREGLPLLTCASGTVGVAMLAIYDFIMAMRHADLCSALVCQALRSTDKAYDPRLLELKNHRETIEVAAYLRRLLAGSEIMDRARNGKVQDSTNTRVLPHVHGAADRMLAQAMEAVMEEFYCVADNPVFFEDGSALMGSNWEETLVQTYCDALAICVANVAKLMEVHMERMVSPTLSGLPAFLVKKPGLNNGFMIVQYVTAGLLGDITLLAQPAGSYNASVSAGQESPITRDDAAARKLYAAVKKLENMISLTMLTALQAVDFLDEKLSPVTQQVHDEARKTVTFMEEDDLMYVRIEAMKALCDSHRLLEIVQSTAGDFVV